MQPEEARSAATALGCHCILGFQTYGANHEEWCPSVTGNYDGLPIIVPDDNGYDKETISG